MIPTAVVSLWSLGLLSVGLVVGGAYLVYEWYRRAWDYAPNLGRSVFDPDLGPNGETALLAAGLGLLLWAFAGGALVRLVLGRDDSPRPEPGAVHRLRRPDGTELHVESHGPEDGPTIVLTHGWCATGGTWRYLVPRLAGRFRLLVWDLPGLGSSTRPGDGEYGAERYARDLEAVLGLAGGRPAVLVGYSFGGMVALTFCRLFPEALGPRVAGLVLVQTTQTNPVRTTRGAGVWTVLERPVLAPLLRLTAGLSPLVRLMDWLGYQNGTTHLMTKRSGFVGAGRQVDFAARFQPRASPVVLARGMLGMLEYDETATLETIRVPTLVVAGDRDPVCLPGASERIRQGVAGAQLETLSPARHWGLVEHDERFAAAVAEFAAACLEAGAPGGAT